MADDAYMDAAELQRVKAWFGSKWKQGPCPVCTETAWQTNQKIGEIYNDKTLSDGTVFPVLLIFCANCGYTLPINARIAGVKTDEAPKTETPSKAEEE
jgi:hypothetical protein